MTRRTRRDFLKHAALAILGAVCLLFLSGCRKAAVERHSERVDTAIVVNEPAYLVKPKVVDNPPWHRELQVVLDQRPENEKEVEALLADHNPAIARAATILLEDIQTAVNAKRQPQDKWSVLSLSCGRTRKTTDIQIGVDVGLTKLYARRPVISFNNMPLDICIAKLSRDSGLQESQQRNFNPRIYWSKTNVSAYEAMEAILTAHGYERKYTDTHYKLALRAQDHASREALIDAVVQAVTEKGKALNAARAGIVVTPKEKEEPAAPPPAPAEKPDAKK